MALPILAAGTILSVLAVIAQYIQAAFAVVNNVLTAIVAWFFRHKIIFSLWLIAVWVVVWQTVTSLVVSVSTWAANIFIGQNPDLTGLTAGLSYLADWVSLRQIASFITLLISLSLAEAGIRNTQWAYSTARHFLLTLSRVFKG